MNSDVTLHEIRTAVAEVRRGADVNAKWRTGWQDAAERLAELVTQLDSHLSAGGTPPEAWSDGPDEPLMDDDEPEPDCEVVTIRWSTRFGYCRNCGLPAAFWLPRAYRKDGEPDDTLRDAPKVCAVCAANAAVDGDGPVRRIADDDEAQR